MIYPEGTRNKTPELALDASKIKSGAFRCASQSEKAILPIKIVGSNKIVRKYGIVDTGTVAIILGKPYNVPKEADLMSEQKKFVDMINAMPDE
jgi:1-acyl-sn-glycerol-3-phosphate acyltransferase